MVRVAGENSILAGGTGAECRRNRGAAGVDASVGACLLFGDLPVGGISGRDFVDQRETEKEKIPFFVFAGRIVAEVRCAGVVRRRSGCRYRLAPYSSYGRIVQNLFAPAYQWGNNLLAYLAERAGSYAFYRTEVWMKSLPTFLVAAVTFVTLIVLAWRNGRTYCNTICPVGTVLGFFPGIPCSVR